MNNRPESSPRRHSSRRPSFDSNSLSSNNSYDYDYIDHNSNSISNSNTPSKQQQQRHNNNNNNKSNMRRRRSPVPTKIINNNGSVIMNKTFQKLLLLLLIIVIFDVLYVWDYFDNLEDITSNGPEAGMHNLHDRHRLKNLYQEVLSGIHLQSNGNSNSNSNLYSDGHMVPNFDLLSDQQKIEELQHEMQVYRGKYETAMQKLGENPYPSDDYPDNNNMNNNKHPRLIPPHTLVPPNQKDDDGVPKPKKTKAQLQEEETFGVDEHIVKILHSANVAIDEELAEQLPTWDDIVSLYGEKPIIAGLEMCESYRDNVKPADRMIGPAGMFNTGTNLLFELMKSNCHIKEARNSQTHYEPRKNGMRWQVPWGKHNPPSTHRNKNIAKAWGKDIVQNNFLPVVLIKDPYSWMGSQCRHKYTTFWGHDDQHCPNLIRWRITDKNVPSEVRVKYALNMKTYESLLDMWNKWYEEWSIQEFPHLTTRFEDLLFHGEEVTRVACDCVGGTFTNNFEYVEDSAKPARGVHKGANGLVKAMLQYGDPEKRLVGFTERDRWYASKNVDTELMNKFEYVAPPLPTG